MEGVIRFVRFHNFFIHVVAVLFYVFSFLAMVYKMHIFISYFFLSTSCIFF